MKRRNPLAWLFLPVIFFIVVYGSYAKRTKTVSDIPAHGQSPRTEFKTSPSVVLAGFLCFLAASVSSAGGIGGGGLFIPVLTMVAGLNLKTASGFSAFMVTGGSLANVMCSVFMSCIDGGKALIDFDIALLSEPCMLLGVSVGVICNVIFPEWLITVLFALFLAWSTFKTCKTGFSYWQLESQEREETGMGKLKTGLVKDGPFLEPESDGTNTEPLLGRQQNCKLSFPWMKLNVLFVVWFSFFVLYLLRGNKYGQIVALIEPCGAAYWTLSALQIPLAITFTAWVLRRVEHSRSHASNQQGPGDSTEAGSSNKFVFPVMALLAGILGGVFGIGGGMLISPLLLHIGIAPEVTAATCSFMVFFSSTMSAVQYLMLRMEHIETALVLAFLCFIASLLGLLVMQRFIKEYGRASLTVFSVGLVMALSALLMTSFEAAGIWRDFRSGKRMGFNPPC